MAERDDSTARNELRFRAANEKLSVRFAELGVDERATLFICECADPRCTAPIRMSVAEYEETHADPARFTVVPEHAGDTGRVVAANERFAVVELAAAA